MSADLGQNGHQRRNDRESPAAMSALAAYHSRLSRYQRTLIQQWIQRACRAMRHGGLKNEERKKWSWIKRWT